jgi:hypothetical protein
MTSDHSSAYPPAPLSLRRHFSFVFIIRLIFSIYITLPDIMKWQGQHTVLKTVKNAVKVHSLLHSIKVGLVSEANGWIWHLVYYSSPLCEHDCMSKRPTPYCMISGTIILPGISETMIYEPMNRKVYCSFPFYH